MRQVLNRTIAIEFYRINTGFFLVCFLLLFGLANGKATIELHYFLMLQIMSRPSFLLIGMVVWLAYAAKCVSYGLRALYMPENELLYTMQAASNKQQLSAWLACCGLMLAPVLLYGIVAVGVGITSGHYATAIFFLCLQAALCWTCARLLMRTVNGSWKQPLWQGLTLPQAKRKNYLSLLLHYSLTERKAAFLGIKVLSLLLLQLMAAVNRYEINRESVSVLIMFLIAAHALLPLYYRQFNEEEMAFTRNLPVPLHYRYLQYAFTYAVIFLPELGFLLVNRGAAMSLPLLCSLYATALSQMLFYTALLYLPGMRTERYTLFVFALFFSSLLFLASFNTWPLFALETVLSAALFSAYYYRYEQPAEQ